MKLLWLRRMICSALSDWVASTESPAFNGIFRLPSKLTSAVFSLSVRRSINVSSIVSSPEKTMDLLVRLCGATGVIRIRLAVGVAMGPPADMLYAVEPVGVDRMTPSAR